MAWVVQLESGRYTGRYRDRDGKKHTVPGGPFTHKAQARRAAEDAEAAARLSGWRDPSTAERMTWSEWCDAWWLTRTVEPSTLISDQDRRRVHVEPVWGT